MRSAPVVTALLAMALFWLGCPSGVAAEGPGEVESPEHGKINTGDASPVDPGHVEIELYYFYGRARRFWDEDRESHARDLFREHWVGLAVTVGIAEGLDISIASCYDWVRDDENDYDESDGELGPREGDHFGDLALGARYRFLNDEGRCLEAAYSASLTAPTGSRNCRREIGTSQEIWSFDQAVAVSKDWGRWTTNAEAGYSLPFGEHRDECRGALCLNLAAGYQAMSWLQPELELNFEHEFLADEDDPWVVAGTAGLVASAGESIGVKLGFQQGLWGSSADQLSSAVLVLRWAF